jgi:hypothetical protein
MTCTSSPSMTATQEFVVPRSIPITLVMSIILDKGSLGPQALVAGSPSIKMELQQAALQSG